LLGGWPHGVTASAALLGVLGFWAGFFAVPVNALIQHRPAAKDRGGIIAAANLLSFAGIALSSGVYYVFTSYIHLNPRCEHGVRFSATPRMVARLILFFVARTLYGVRVLGREYFPQKSGALLVCNHMFFADAALLIAATDRPIRFLMYQGIYDLPIVKPVARIMKAIPISGEQHPREMIRSLQMAAEALREGEIVCIFAEGCRGADHPDKS
jgi:acyl-[acyl-carrier-protein]-phospholipid O-acyltransferase / long-chain-fatty-acid--[acyl-carrier-protein] ligase